MLRIVKVLPTLTPNPPAAAWRTVTFSALKLVLLVAPAIDS